MWGRGRRRKKKEVGRLGCNCHCYQSPAFLGTLGGMWKGEKRQLKPVGVGPVPHPHPGHWGQLCPFCWTRLDLGFLGSPGFQAIPPWLSVPIFPGTPWEGCLCASVAETLACFPLSLPLFSTGVCEFMPTFLQSLWLGLSLSARTYFFTPRLIPSKVFCWPLGSRHISFHSWLGSLSLSLLLFPRGNNFSIPDHLSQRQWAPQLGWASGL